MGSEKIELFDLNGRLVHKQKVVSEEEINIKSISNGVYILRVFREDKLMKSFTMPIGHIP